MAKSISNLSVGLGSSSATLDDIKFNNIKWSDGQNANTRRTKSDQPWSKSNSTSLSSFSVNAVDIDWNNAELTGATGILTQPSEGFPTGLSTITTTGELIKVIVNLQGQVNVLTDLVKGLYVALNSNQ